MEGWGWGGSSLLDTAPQVLCMVWMLHHRAADSRCAHCTHTVVGSARVRHACTAQHARSARQSRGAHLRHVGLEGQLHQLKALPLHPLRQGMCTTHEGAIRDGTCA